MDCIFTTASTIEEANEIGHFIISKGYEGVQNDSYRYCDLDIEYTMKENQRHHKNEMYIGVSSDSMIVCKTKRALRRKGFKFIEKKRMFYELCADKLNESRTKIGGQSMKVNDLMIGDWVEVDGEYTDVTQISRTEISTSSMKEVDIKDVRPIPITAQCLEDSRFIKRNHPGYPRHYTYELPCEGLPFEIFSMYDTDFSFNINNEARKIKYVHELQHALRLCKIDKEIML